jgi:chromosome segregation ATPase
MTTEERLDRAETELAIIRQLLTSAATYAESGNRKFEQLTEKVDDLTQTQNRTQAHLDQVITRQDATDTKLDQLSQKVDNFVTHTQRLFNQAAGDIETTKSQAARLEAILFKLDRNYAAQQSQLREFQQTTNLVLERIDTQQTEIRHIWEYLRHRNGGSSPPAD